MKETKESEELKTGRTSQDVTSAVLCGKLLLKEMKSFKNFCLNEGEQPLGFITQRGLFRRTQQRKPQKETKFILISEINTVEQKMPFIEYLLSTRHFNKLFGIGFAKQASLSQKGKPRLKELSNSPKVIIRSTRTEMKAQMCLLSEPRPFHNIVLLPI